MSKEEEEESFEEININELMQNFFEEDEEIEKQIGEKQSNLTQFDDKLAALMIERNYYLRVLQNLSKVVERVPALEQIGKLIQASPQELQSMKQQK